MRTIIVTSTDKLWEEAQKLGKYEWSTINVALNEIGFIHATTPDQVTPMLNRHFTNRNDILLLLVDVDKVQPEIKYEAPASGTPGLFPHIYGAVNLDAIYGTLKPNKDSTGNFSTSEALTKLNS